MPLYDIFVYSFCIVLKYHVLDGKLGPPRCDSYPLNIHYCCPLTEADCVTVLEDRTICNAARQACENVLQYSTIYWHYLKWYVNNFYQYLQ